MACSQHSWIPFGDQFLRCARCGNVVLRSNMPDSTLNSANATEVEPATTESLTRQAFSENPLTAEDFKGVGRQRFKARQYSEAMPLLKAAAAEFPEDETLWQELVLSASLAGHHDQAAEFATEAIRQHPRSDWLWSRLGSELTEIGRVDEAEKALNNALVLNPSAARLWGRIAEAHRTQKNLEKEIDALERLYESGMTDSTDLNNLGIAYHNRKNWQQALHYYRLSAAAGPGYWHFFNMGLVFNEPEVALKVDAADAFRRALALMSGYERAKEELEKTKKGLIQLAERGHAAAIGLIQPDEFFQTYVSPFEAFRLDEVVMSEGSDVLKTIQRAKKKLLQEIDLEGKVHWLENCALEKSRAHKLDDELIDATRRHYHLAIFQNKPLLRFLTRGDIGHFLYSDDYFPRATLDLLDNDPGFRTFLGKLFARQYDAVLTRAIRRHLLPVIEVLFGGRRWVTPADEDICFGGAEKCIGELVELIRSKQKKDIAPNISLCEIEDVLRQHSLREVFNLSSCIFRRIFRFP